MKQRITLQLMSVEDKLLLARLLELYHYEFTAYTDADISEYGCYGYDHIDDYWNEEGRYPYLIRVDGKIAGFALVCPHCNFIKGENVRSIGEFFVMIKYRRMGVGKKVAKEIFDRHKGTWELCYLKNNVSSLEFWKNVLSEYTNDCYSVCGENDRVIGFTFKS